MARTPSRGRALFRPWLVAFLLTVGMTPITPYLLQAQADDPSPPKQRVKLIFIHHSCGENWLTDGHGNLGEALARNNYFVSDTNYGWGPNSIGDRTDITDWPEWFTGPQSGRIMEALRGESGRLSSYARGASDPGGENRIILFKSCFPNSNLEGAPTDPPRRGHGLTVGNAKAIYNELLTYFRTQPGTLFVALTAPPVQDPTYGANARAFNNWLVREWLADYRGSNVAVFDFYNVLTGAENHHRFRDGAIEHITNRGGNTLRYPTDGDNHPSPAGNRKATREIVPLLNVFFHRWQKNAPTASAPGARGQSEVRPPLPEATPARPEPPSQEPAPPPSTAEKVDEVLDDFEGEADAWAVFSDEGSDTRVSFALDEANAQSGRAGLRIEYDVAPASWGTCSLVYSSPRDWRNWHGLSLRLRSEEPRQKVVIVAYQGETSDDLSHFEFHTQTDEAAVNGWQRIEIPWSELIQPSWQGDSTVPFDPAKAMGVAFAFDAPETGRNTGRLWVDDIRVLPNTAHGTKSEE
jgi:hypothetical protein